MRLAVVVTAVLILHAAPAAATTVEVRTVDVSSKSLSTERHASVTATPGQADRLTVSGAGELVVSGAGLSPGAGCSGGGTEVRCAGPIAAVDVDLGDADDTLEVLTQSLRIAFVDAGPGDDVVTGAPVASGGEGADILTGTPGADVLVGAAGADVLRGAGGGDSLDGGADPDVLDGGPGVDMASYFYRRDPVTVDLAAGTGDDDRLVAVEGAQGGAGADTLRGSEGADVLDGGAGDDRVEGRDGDDAIGGWDGDDVLSGGAGDDALYGFGGRDALDGGEGDDALYGGEGLLRCGTGRDEVLPGRRVTLRRDCESVGTPRLLRLDRMRAGSGRIAWRARRGAGERDRVTVRVRLPGGHLVGRARVRAGGRRTSRVQITLDRRGRRALAGPGELSLRVSISSPAGWSFAWTALV